LHGAHVELHVAAVVVGEGIQPVGPPGQVCLVHRTQRVALGVEQREAAVAVVHQVKVAEGGRKLVDSRLRVEGRQTAGRVVVDDVGSIHVDGGDGGARRVKERVDPAGEVYLHGAHVELHVAAVVVGEGIQPVGPPGQVCLVHRTQRVALGVEQREAAVAVVHQVKVAEGGRKLVDSRLRVEGRQTAGRVVVDDVGSIHVDGGDGGARRVKERVDPAGEVYLHGAHVVLHFSAVLLGQHTFPARRSSDLCLVHRTQRVALG